MASTDFEFFTDHETASVRRHKLDRAFNAGRRVIWNMKGMRRVVPSEVLANAIDLLDDYEAIRHAWDAPARDLGTITWEQTVPLVELEEPKE